MLALVKQAVVATSHGPFFFSLLTSILGFGIIPAVTRAWKGLWMPLRILLCKIYKEVRGSELRDQDYRKQRHGANGISH